MVTPGSPSTPQYTSMPSIQTPEGELKLRNRFKTVSDLVGSYQTLWWADIASAYARTLNQQQRDGAPPYDPGTERLNGLAGRANINWGMSDQIATEAEMPYNELLEAIDNLCTLPTNHGTDTDRTLWEEVMAEEFSRVIRAWPEFTPLWQINARMFVDEGVSFIFFEDDLNWEWDVKGMQHLVFPRRTRANINCLDTICCKVDMSPSALYSRCQNDDAAAAEGWDKEEVLKALKQSAGQHGLPSNDWQEWEKAWRNNDLFQGVTNITVETVHGWVKEVDGTISHYIARFDGQGGWLYKSEGKYRRMSNMLVAYLYGVGTNNDFHSIRGVLSKTSAACAGINRVFNRTLDMAYHSSTPFLQAQDENTITELPLMPMGQYAIMKPGVSFVENKMPNFQENLIPILGVLQQFLSSRSSTFTSSDGGADGQDKTRRTAYEKQMQYAAAGKLSTSGMSLFKVGFTQHMREVVRRFIRPSYSSDEPGGWAVTNFRHRCMVRGVPEEAINRIDVDRIEVNIGLGKGSAVERQNVVAQLYTMVYPNLDAEGKNRLLNMVIASNTDSRTANVLAPLKPGLRPPQDTENAQLENGLLVLGQPVEVLLNQDHEVHLEVHIAKLDQLNQELLPAMDSLQNAVPGQDTQPQAQQYLEQIMPQMSAVFQHAEQHFELLSPVSSKLPIFKDQMSQFNQAISNGSKQLASQQLKMMKEAQHNNGMVGGQQMGEQDGTPANASTLVQQVEAASNFRQASQDLQHNQETHQMKLALERQKLVNMQNDAYLKQKDSALKDAKTAADIGKRGNGRQS